MEEKQQIIQIAIQPYYVNSDGDTHGGRIFGLDNKGEIYLLEQGLNEYKGQWALIETDTK